MAAAKTVVGGDDVRAIVADCGSWAVRVGSAGDDTPRALVPSARGIRPSSADQDVQMKDAAEPNAEYTAKPTAGDVLLTSPQAFSDIQPIYKLASDGTASVHDWDAMQAVWEACTSSLRLPLKSSPLFLVEPSRMWTDEERAKALERAFEGCGVPAAFVARGGAMAAFSAARTTACVVDVGHQGAVAVPVLDGFILKKGVRGSDVGGGGLTDRLVEWTEKQTGKELMAIHEVKKVRKEGEGRQFEVTELNAGGKEEGHKRFYRRIVAEEMKAYCMKVSTGEEGKERMSEYELPDGNVVDLKQGGANLADVLFDTVEPATVALPELALRAVSACDVDARRDLFGGVVVVGGSSLIPGVVERLTKELAVATPQMYKLKVHASANAVERSCGAWIGGSIVASLGTFQQAWVSRAEYDELGAVNALRKCP